MVLGCLLLVSDFRRHLPYVCIYYISSVWIAEWSPFGIELLTRLTICSLCNFDILRLVWLWFSVVLCQSFGHISPYVYSYYF